MRTQRSDYNGDRKTVGNSDRSFGLAVSICFLLTTSFFFLGVAVGKGRFASLGIGKKQGDNIREAGRDYFNATAYAIYHLAHSDLTEKQRDAFERRLEVVSSEGDDDMQPEYVAIGSDITLAAVYGITDDDPTELLMGKAREKMLDAKLDQRKMMILELQHLAQMALSARLNVTIDARYLDYLTREKIKRGYNDFERAKKLLEAALMKYSELYPPAPTH